MIKWSYEGEAGFWHSEDRRFDINPNFRHTVNPDSYTVRDNSTGEKHTYDRVRDCKERAERMLAKPYR
jgi:hypothetical protein